MATNFVARDYVNALQALLNRHEIPIKVEGFTQKRDFAKFGELAVAELQIESLQTSPTGELRELDAVLTAGLLVMVRLDDDEAEEAALELALDVATALIDELPEEVPLPLMAAGPIQVSSIEPEYPDGALQYRVAGYLITFEQQWRIVRSNNVIYDPPQISTLFLGKDPDVGIAHEADYVQLVPEQE